MSDPDIYRAITMWSRLSHQQAQGRELSESDLQRLVEARDQITDLDFIQGIEIIRKERARAGGGPTIYL